MSAQQAVSARKAAQLLDVSDTTIRNWIADGVIQATRSKPRQPWRIPIAEIERVRDCGADTTSADHEQGSADAGESRPPSADAKFEVRSANAKARSANTNTEVRSSNFAASAVGPSDHENEDGRSEREALLQELTVLRVKLEASEERNEATRREQETLREMLERADGDINHLRGLTTQQAGTMQNLTEEIKGLTIALHHEQGQRLQLESHVKDEEEDQKPKRAGLFRGVFSRKRKKKFARVGPSPT